MNKFSFTVILFIGLFLSFYGYGQNIIDKNEYKASPSEKIEKSNAIFVTPLNFFDFQNPNFQIGYERFVAKKWSLQIEGAIMIPHSIIQYVTDLSEGIKNCHYTNKGFRVKGSVKHIVKEKRIFKMYISPELFYYRNKSGIARGFLISDPNFEYSFDVPEWKDSYYQFFYNNEKKIGINFKVGFKIFIGKSFFVEPHGGFGFAHRKVVHTGRENPNDKLGSGLSAFKIDGINHDYSSLWIFDKAASNKWIPTIPLNVKIGVRF